MGINQIAHVFIGRLCSESEKLRCFEQLKDVNEDEMCDVFNVEDACYLQSDDGNPIVPFTYGWGYDSDVLTRPIDEFTWFVVADYVKTVRSETEESFIDLGTLNKSSKQQDERYVCKREL